MARELFIVARDRADLFRYLSQTFADPGVVSDNVRCRRYLIGSRTVCLDAGSRLLLWWQDHAVNAHAHAQGELLCFPLRTAASDGRSAS